jgi:hypothetical protein
MQLKACDCRVEHYRRGHRAWWMRLPSSRRLFHCYGCDALLFIDPHEVSERLAHEKKKKMKTSRHRPQGAPVPLHRT